VTPVRASIHRIPWAQFEQVKRTRRTDAVAEVAVTYAGFWCLDRHPQIMTIISAFSASDHWTREPGVARELFEIKRERKRLARHRRLAHAADDHEPTGLAWHGLLGDGAGRVVRMGCRSILRRS
jgi:transposase